MRKEWTKQEEFFLISNAARKPVSYISKKLERSISSITSKARKMGVNLFQGTYTIRGVCRELGCGRYIVWKIIDELNMRIKRRGVTAKKDGYCMISDEQLEKICDGYDSYLECRDRWAPELGIDSCIICGRDDREHSAKGFCARCYRRQSKIGNKKLEWYIRIRAAFNQMVDAVESGSDIESSIMYDEDGFEFKISLGDSELTRIPID